MTRRKTLIGALVLSVLAGGHAPTTARAQAGDTVELEFFPKDAAAGRENPVIVRFRGKEYREPVSIHDTRDASAKLDREANFLATVIAANRGESLEGISRYWQPGERAAFLQRMTAEALEKNRLFYNGLQTSELIATVRYGPYVLGVVAHSGRLLDRFLHVYPLIETGEGLFLTNRLRDDPMFHFFIRVYGASAERNPAESEGSAPGKR